MICLVVFMKFVSDWDVIIIVFVVVLLIRLLICEELFARATSCFD